MRTQSANIRSRVPPPPQTRKSRKSSRGFCRTEHRWPVEPPERRAQRVSPGAIQWVLPAMPVPRGIRAEGPRRENSGGAVIPWADGSATIVRQSGTKTVATPFIQYLRPVGGGPSGKTWPRWPPQLLQWTSVRTIPWLSSWLSSIESGSGLSKLGHPVPLSNFFADENNFWPHPAQTNAPSRVSWSKAQLPGRSVPWPRSTAYCSGVSRRRHSASVCWTG